MALRASLAHLTRQFHTPTAAAPMQWMRQLSTSQIIRQSETSSDPTATNTANTANTTTPVMPGVLAAGLRTPNELSTSLDPYAGRSIGSVTNPNTAFRKLNMILAQNSVRKELRQNRYYEKPNVARRRKNIARNRKLFGAMVGKKVALIMQMKQRGM